jgi:hypothetical protein
LLTLEVCWTVFRHARRRVGWRAGLRRLHQQRRVAVRQRSNASPALTSR